jgi:hypothetical protein
MSYLVVSDSVLPRFAAPSLPLGPEEYSRQYQDQLNNVLRLYFNQIQTRLGDLRATGAPCTVDELPNAAESGVGARAFVTNALTPTFGATVVGGGAVAVPVYSDGTNWQVG